MASQGKANEDSIRFITASIYKLNEGPVGIALKTTERNGNVLVSRVREHSLFRTTELNVGDQLYSVNNIAVTHASTASALIASSSGFVTLTLVRSEHEFDWGKVKGSLFAVAASKQYIESKIGVSLKQKGERVLISKITDSSLFAASGLSIGDAVLSINNAYPKSVQEALSIVESSIGTITFLVDQKQVVCADIPDVALCEPILLVTAQQVDNEGETNFSEVLRKLGLQPFEDIFRINGVESSSDLKLLTEDNMKELGIIKIGERNRLLKWIKDHSDSSMRTAPQVVTTSAPMLTPTTATLVGVSPTEVALERLQDQQKPKRIQLSQQAARTITQRLQQSFPTDLSTATHFLRTKVVVASDGSVSGRQWAAEFGCGYAKFSMLWRLDSPTMNQTPAWIRIDKKDSGCIGLKDFGAGDFGWDAVIKMADKAAQEILERMGCTTGIFAPTSGSNDDPLARAFLRGVAEGLGEHVAGTLLD